MLKKEKSKKCKAKIILYNGTSRNNEKSKESLYTIDKAIEDIKIVFDELKIVEEKYDYSKLPKDM